METLILRSRRLDFTHFSICAVCVIANFLRIKLLRLVCVVLEDYDYPQFRLTLSETMSNTPPPSF